MANKDKYILTDKDGRTIVMEIFGIWDAEVAAIKECKKYLKNKEDIEAYDIFLSLVDKLTATPQKFDCDFRYNNNNTKAPTFSGFDDRDFERCYLHKGKYHLDGVVHDNYYNNDYLYYMVAPAETIKPRGGVPTSSTNTTCAKDAHQNLITLEKLNKNLKQLLKAIWNNSEGIKTKYDQWYEGIREVQEKIVNYDYNEYQSYRKRGELEEERGKYLRKYPPPALVALDLVRDMDEVIFPFNKKMEKLLNFEHWNEKHLNIKKQLFCIDGYAVAFRDSDEDPDELYFLSMSGGENILNNARFFPNPEKAAAAAKKYQLKNWMVVKFGINALEVVKENDLSNSALHSLIDEENIEKGLGKKTATTNKKLKI